MVLTPQLIFWSSFAAFVLLVFVVAAYMFWKAHFERRKLNYHDPSPHPKRRGLTREEREFVKHIRAKYE